MNVRGDDREDDRALDQKPQRDHPQLTKVLLVVVRLFFI
jgi:hypothetical protein